MNAYYDGELYKSIILPYIPICVCKQLQSLFLRLDKYYNNIKNKI